MPWNYEDYFVILLPKDTDQYNEKNIRLASQNLIKIESGSLTLDAKQKKVIIDLTILKYKGSHNEPSPFPCNGTYHYTIDEPYKGPKARRWLEGIYYNGQEKPYFGE
jgi:hypothetical protein